MRLEDVAVATMTWARDDAEARVIEHALAQLRRLDVRVVVTDGGSSDAFIRELASTTGFSVRRSSYGRGLVGQVKSSIAAALDTGAQAVLYTEPDKTAFFAHGLPSLLECAPPAATGRVMLAARSSRSFSTFPPFQQYAEAIINDLCARVVGIPGDYSYGPFLMDRELAERLLTMPNTLGWGWRHCAFGLAAGLGYDIRHGVDDFACPEEQRHENQRDRFHRLTQLHQNAEGLLFSCRGGHQPRRPRSRGI
jgi:hypothetical protein